MKHQIVMNKRLIFLTVDKRLLYPVAYVLCLIAGLGLWGVSYRGHVLRAEHQAQIDHDTAAGYRELELVGDNFAVKIDVADMAETNARFLADEPYLTVIDSVASGAGTEIITFNRSSGGMWRFYVSVADPTWEDYVALSVGDRFRLSFTGLRRDEDFGNPESYLSPVPLTGPDLGIAEWHAAQLQAPPPRSPGLRPRVTGNDSTRADSDNDSVRPGFLSML